MKKNYNLITTGLLLASITSILAQCPVPSLVTASPSVICAGATTSLNATALGASINWFTVPVGGVAVGTSASAANFTTSSISTATYYAESFVASSAGSQVFSFTGSMQTFTVPLGITTLSIAASGAQGGVGTNSVVSGKGARTAATLTVTPGQILNIYVGGQGTVVAGGYNGGGNGGINSGATAVGGGGGGATDIRIGGSGLANRIMVAAGGGGSGGGISYTPIGGDGGAGSSCVSPNGVGGGAANGCSLGSIGTCAGGLSSSYGQGGSGAGLTSGGQGGGTGYVGTGAPGCPGILGVGGVGGGTVAVCGGTNDGVSGAGGGGGGYYGGGGGMSGSGGCHGGGGGGSSYVDNFLFTSIVFTSGIQVGNGQVSVLWGGPGCTSASRTPVIVTVNALPTVSVTSGAICSGKSYTIVASGANTYTYSSGSAVVSPTTTTNYSVTGTNTLGCVSSNTAVSTVTVNATPVVMATTSNSLICAGEMAILTASTSAMSYTWNTGATTMSVSVSPTVTSTYTVNATATNGCVGMSNVMVTVNACTSVPNLTANTISFNIYPNPNNGLFVVELNSATQVIVTNNLGQVLVNQTMNIGKQHIDIQNQANGIYFVKLIQNGNQQTIKLIKE